MESIKKMRFNEKWVKQHIELDVKLTFNNGLRGYYDVPYVKQRIELSKHYGVENTQICTKNGNEVELDIIEIKNCKYMTRMVYMRILKIYRYGKKANWYI